MVSVFIAGLLSARLDVDLLRLSLGCLRQRHRQNAVLEPGLHFVGVYLGGKLEASREAERAPLVAMHRVTFGRLDLTLALDRERGRRGVELEVFFGKPRKLGANDEYSALIIE